ncbi:class I SAM-dependent methyltransferase [Actinopolymorpha pittospori]
MPAIVNTHQAEAWNGYEGHHWAEYQERYDLVNGGMNAPLFDAAAIAETDRVLDVGCGNGQTTRLAARKASRGHAVGVDLSAPMLERARASTVAEGIDNATFVQGDAQVYPFEENAFDVAISRGGIMFFSDPVAAFANIGRALRPGGRLTFVCAQEVSREDPFARALAPLWALMRGAQEARKNVEGADDERQRADRDGSGPGAETGGVGPTSLADPERTDAALSAAGFTQVSIEPLRIPMVFGTDVKDAADFFLLMGPMEFNLRGIDPVAVASARDEVAVALREYVDENGVSLPSALWLVQARRPG